MHHESESIPERRSFLPEWGPVAWLVAQVVCCKNCNQKLPYISTVCVVGEKSTCSGVVANINISLWCSTYSSAWVSFLSACATPGACGFGTASFNCSDWPDVQYSVPSRVLECDHSFADSIS